MKAIVISSILVMLSTLAHSSSSIKGEFKDSYMIFNSADGNYQFKLDGRIMLDFGTVDSDENPDIIADTDFRRLRLSIKTMLFKDWAAEFDLDFEGNEVDTKDMWLSYMGIDNWNFKIGHHKPNFSIAEVTTSRWYTFMEVPTAVEMYGPSRRIGVSANHWQSGFFAGLSIFGDEADVNASDLEDDNDGVSERFGYSFRAAIRPFNFNSNDAKRVLHLAINHMLNKPQSEDEDEFRLRSRLESKVGDYRFLDTGNMGNVDDSTVNGIEVLYLHDNWFVQSEYFSSEVSFTNGDPSFDSTGYYVQGSYFLTGSGRSYGFDDAELGAVKPANGQSDMEIALRYSVSDLDDSGAGILGGQSDIITLGFNWYLNTNIVIRTNYIMADLNENADGDGDFVGNDKVNMLTARVQVMF
ncbi:OprO/OprP family phosphate-selective porin [Pleionea sediminis]|uniref:OprO/OprP family phosphate-selective porin n=1 Tax=Pleionea sediminis TaxID=2569479 RepID=UPI0011851E2E|nr:porin [Pleionea sediminis]